VACIDAYCAHYRPVCHHVRHFEQFTQLILGMLAETTRKSLPRLAKTVQGEHQALQHFLANAEWSLEELRAIRLRLLRMPWLADAARCASMKRGIPRKARPPTMSPPSTWAVCIM
jgi:SRSO17 transposase